MSKSTTSKPKVNYSKIKTRDVSRERSTKTIHAEETESSTAITKSKTSKAKQPALSKVGAQNTKSNSIKTKPSVPNASSKSSTNLNKVPLSSTSKAKLPDAKKSPYTPTSNRVIKSQYFPSKKLYSDVVGSENLDQSTPRVGEIKSKKNEIRSTKTLKSQIKAKKEVTPKEALTSDLERTVERPRTATLRKGSIVNSNIAGPDVPKNETPSLTSLDLSYELENEANSEYNYEDDFDSYESDFEQYVSSESSSLSSSNNQISGKDEEETSSESLSAGTTSKHSLFVNVEEEKMLDSGTFEIMENKHIQLLDNIKEVEQEVQPIPSNLASLSDEGFEEARSLTSANIQFLNFTEAQKKWKQSKNLEKQQKRGKDILSMIKLDYYNFNLIDIAPIPYDLFIKSYGKNDGLQVSTQTGEDNTDEEIQTDEIETQNKWTQYPISVSKIDCSKDNYLEIYREEYFGVGGDSIPQKFKQLEVSYATERKLDKFISFAGQIMLNILSYSANDALQDLEKSKRDLPFSAGFKQFNTKSTDFLRNRSITYMTICSEAYVNVLTVHKKIGEDEGEVGVEAKDIVCMWSTLDFEEPEKIFVTSESVSCCCYTTTFKNYLFGGLCDGSLTVWSLSSNWQDEIKKPNNTILNKKWFQESTYTTEINSGHCSKVITIKELVDSNTEDVFNNNNIVVNNQICSLDEDGTLIIWTFIVKDVVNKQYVLPWNQLSLVPNIKLSIKNLNEELKALLCTDLNISPLDSRHIFISTNYGCIHHYLTSGSKAIPRKYTGVTTSEITCLESCPFSEGYFVAGCGNGTIMLYSRSSTKPLMIMTNSNSNQDKVQFIQWSHTKPCVLYVKDSANTLHVWDFTVSDLSPVYSIPLQEKVSYLRLTQPTKQNDCSYMVLATESGNIYLHLLNSDFGRSDPEQYQQDSKKFLNYVNRL